MVLTSKVNRLLGQEDQSIIKILPQIEGKCNSGRTSLTMIVQNDHSDKYCSKHNINITIFIIIQT